MNDIFATETGHNSLSNNDSLLVALFLAAVAHVFILLGINFSAPQPPKVSKSIEVTLSHAPLKKAPKQAKFLAPDHQLGAGDELITPPKPLKENLPTPNQEVMVQTPKMNPQPTQQMKKPVVEKIISKPEAITKVPLPIEEADEPTEVVEEKPKITAESLQQQIAQLGEQIRTSQQNAQDTKIKFVSSVSTHKYLAAQYVKDWEDKVERTGNLNYPEAARNKSQSQSLTMDVGIKADGSIYNLRIVQSSGNPLLDDAAKRIVKMSAPFAALPVDLLKELNVLVITRVWKFSDETGMTAR